MARLCYANIVRQKLKRLQAGLKQKYGDEVALKTIRKITQGARRLEMFPQSGVRVAAQYGIESEYRYIFVAHNYLFYRIIDENNILILEMFHEKEDFMRKLFGIVEVPDEKV